MAGPQIIVEYIAKTAELGKAAGEISQTGGKVGAAMRKAVVPATAALAAVGAASAKAIDAASSLNEQISASQQTFGKHAKGMQAWAKTGAEAFGLSTEESLKAANAYGNMFATVGLGTRQTADMSKAMVQLAGDMASFHDQDPTEMLEKLQSGLAGEAEPLRKFGVLISDAAVKQEAYRKGIAKNGAELTEAQKVQARYALIMDQTTKAQGDFARTSGSVANQQRTLAAQNENVAASFGQVLLPVTQTFMGMLRGLLEVIGGNRTVLTVMIGVVSALAAAILLTNAAVAAWSAVTTIATGVTKVWSAAQIVLNAVLAANPILLVVAAVAALVAAFIVAYKTSDTFRRVVDGAFDAVLGAAKAVWNWLRANWPLLLGILAGPFGLAVGLIVKHWDAISDAAKDAVSAVKGALSSLAGWISGVYTATIGTAVRAVGAVFDWVADGARDAYASVQRNLNGIVSFIEGLVGKVRSAATSVANAIKAPINAVVDAWNGLEIPRVSIKIPSIKIGKKKIGGGDFGFGPFPFPDIPRLAAGGVASTPTLALIGEGVGREIVAPETLLREIVADGAPTVHVYIGDTELRGIVRTEIVGVNGAIARTLMAGGA